MNMRLGIVIFFLLVVNQGVFSQVQDIKLDPVKVEKFLPYLKFKHSSEGDFETWKSNHMLQYTKEMWYFSESFYIKRDLYTDGTTMDESQIYISRFESQRKENEEVTIKMPGFRDAIVLIPGNKLIHKVD
jgi:hypothetical protein